MKLLTNELYKSFLETIKEKIVDGSVVGVKNEDGTYTAVVPAYTLDAFCKENDIDFNATLENAGFKKGVGLYSIDEINKIAKDYTYTTGTEGINVEVILDEYFRAGILGCLNKNSIHNKLTARSIPVDSQDVRITYQKRIADTAVDLAAVAEGAQLPELTNLEFGSELLTLGKVGGELKLTYEVVRSAKIKLLNVHYQAVATAYDLAKDANIISVIKNGHSTVSGKYENATAGRGGAISTVVPSISVADILPVIKYFATYGINLKYAVMNFATLRNILGIEQFSTPLLYDTAITGNLTPFLGLEVVLSEDLNDGEILAVDPAKAVEEYVFQPFASESDKNIETQHYIKTFYEISGYALVNPNAATIITVDADADWELPALKDPEDPAEPGA